MTKPLSPETLALHADDGLEPLPDVAPPIRLTGFIRLILTVRQGTPPSVCIEEVSKHYDD